jgi:hypothetical protein
LALLAVYREGGELQWRTDKVFVWSVWAVLINMLQIRVEGEVAIKPRCKREVKQIANEAEVVVVTS